LPSSFPAKGGAGLLRSNAERTRRADTNVLTEEAEATMKRATAVRKAKLILASGILLAAGAANASSWSTDITDIWWNPNESGWGVNMIQTGNQAFVTFFVYGSDRKPTWFGGTLQDPGSTSETIFSGDLYATSGPYFGGSFNPGDVTRRKAGSASFTLTGVSTGTLQYTVDGVQVTKQIERQPIAYDDYSGTYDVVYSYKVSGCNDPSYNGWFVDIGSAVIKHNRIAMSVELNDVLGIGTCTSAGTYGQNGRMGSYAGSYSCTWGEVGTMRFLEMNNAPYKFMARLDFPSSNYGCVVEGDVVGVQ